jgi:elongation factor G
LTLRKCAAAFRLPQLLLRWNGRAIKSTDRHARTVRLRTGLYEGERAADGVVVVISAKSGVSVGAEKGYKLAYNQKKRSCSLSTRWTRTRTFTSRSKSCVKTFGDHVCPLVIRL